MGDPGMLASRGGGIPPLPVGAGPSVLGGGGEGAGGGGRRRAQLTSASGKLRSWAAACVPKTGGKKNLPYLVKAALGLGKSWPASPPPRPGRRRHEFCKGSANAPADGW